jgi:hypothetical protein
MSSSVVSSNPAQYLAEIDAIELPAEASAGAEFVDLRANLVRRHVGGGMSEPERHRATVDTLRQLVEAAQAVLDFYADQPPAPGEHENEARRIRDAVDSKRAYAQLLDTLERACGTLCCRDEEAERPAIASPTVHRRRSG